LAHFVGPSCYYLGHTSSCMGRWFNHFIGSLFSRQLIYAYTIGSGATTLLYGLLLLRQGVWGQQKVVTANLAGIGAIIDIYVRVALPIWIPPITMVEVGVVLINCFFALCVLAWWSAKYASATGGRRHRRSF